MMVLKLKRKDLGGDAPLAAGIESFEIWSRVISAVKRRSDQDR